MTIALPSQIQGRTLSETIDELHRLRYEDSLYAFTVAAWPHIDSAPFAHGGYALQAICEHLEACAEGYIPNLLVNVPPRFSKSTICGVMFPAWVWAQRAKSSLLGPGAQFLCAGYAMPLSLQDSVKCRTLIQSDWYQKYWGDRFMLVGDQNTKTRFQNDKNGIRNTVSVGGATTGLGGSYLIGDDLNNSADANSEAIIESTINWWDTAWYNRLNNSKPGFGCRIVIAQRLSQEDICGHILEKQIGDWTHLMLPMRYESDRSFHTVLVPGWATDDGESVTWDDPRTVEGELLWPERFDEQQVRLLERTLGPTASAGQLQQRPEVKGGGVIKRDWWMLWPHDAYPPMDLVVASLDTAYTTKTENDYSALTVWGVFSGVAESGITQMRDRYGKVIDMQTSKGNATDAVPRVMLMAAWQERLELHDLVEKVLHTCKTLLKGIDILLIEDKAAGHSVAQEIRRLYGASDFAVQLQNPGAQDKLSRLYSVQHLFAEGLIYAPDRSWADMVITQVGAFPKGKHDDLCLVGETLITMADGSTKRVDMIDVGEMVATPVGPSKVSASGFTGIRKIWRLEHEHGVLKGTANHPVYVDGGWKELGRVCPYDTVTLYQHKDTTSWVSNQKTELSSRQSSSMATSTIVIQSPLTRRIVATLGALVIGCIETCGSFITALSRKAIKSITSMRTPLTMTYQTLSACPSSITGRNTTINMLSAVGRRSNSHISEKPDTKQQTGTRVKKGARGIVTSVRSIWTKLVPTNALVMRGLFAERDSANGAVLSSSLESREKLFVPVHAKQRSQNTSRVKQVKPIHISRPVYNLTVEGAHCYYANGILTHNCDTVSQALNYLRTTGILIRSQERLAEIESTRRDYKSSSADAPLYWT